MLSALGDRLLLSWVRRELRSRRIATSAGRVHVLDGPGRGDLPPVLLLHGIASAAAHWAEIFPRLPVRRLIAPDLPGHGASDVPRRLTPDLAWAGLSEALDRVVDEPCVVVGVSLGGLCAVRWALSRPELARGLVLLSPAGAPLAPGLLDRLRPRTHAEALRFVDALFERPHPLRHPLAWGVRARFGARPVRDLLSGLTPGDLLAPAELARLTMPVHLAWGAAERVFPPEDLAFFRRHLPPHAVIERPPGWGHAPFLDDPAGVARRITAMCEAVARRAAA